MLNKKGQALIEFVLILPVLIMLIFAFIDLAMILVEKNELVNLTSAVVDKLDEVSDYDSVYNYVNSITDKKTELYLIYQHNGEIYIKLERDRELITPFLNLVLSNPYKITSERVIINE